MTLTLTLTLAHNWAVYVVSLAYEFTSIRSDILATLTLTLSLTITRTTIHRNLTNNSKYLCISVYILLQCTWHTLVLDKISCISVYTCKAPYAQMNGRTLSPCSHQFHLADRYAFINILYSVPVTGTLAACYRDFSHTAIVPVTLTIHLPITLRNIDRFLNLLTSRLVSKHVKMWSLKSHHTSNKSLNYLVKCGCQETSANRKEMPCLTRI